jgi:hypothetical protein
MTRRSSPRCCVCRDERIGLIVPTRDEELSIFAETGRFSDEGTVLRPLPTSSRVETSAGSSKPYLALALAPLTFEDPALAPLPAFVKPRIGKGGGGARIVASRADLAATLAALGDDAIVQEVVEAPDTRSTCRCARRAPHLRVPRERVLSSAGIGRLLTVRDAGLTEASPRLAAAIGLVGHVTIQAFRTREHVLFIEINPLRRCGEPGIWLPPHP